MIEAALAKGKGRVAGPRGAAAKLGIPRSTSESKIKQLKLEISWLEGRDSNPIPCGPEARRTMQPCAPGAHLASTGRSSRIYEHGAQPDSPQAVTSR